MNIFNKSFVRGYIVGLVSVLVTATSCAEIHYVTQTVDGLEWRLRLDDVAMTASVGTNVTSSAWASAGNYATSSAIDNKSKVEPLQIPSSFTVDGQVYRVTAIGNRAFIRANMTSLIVPEMSATSTIARYTSATTLRTCGSRDTRRRHGSSDGVTSTSTSRQIRC